MILKNIFYLFLSTCIFSFTAIGHEKTWPERRLRQAWPEAKSFISKQISLTNTQVSNLKNEGIKIDSNERDLTFYMAQENISGASKTFGLILFVDATGDNASMEISVAMGGDGRVKKVDIWEHSENALVAQSNFLKQFEGKSVKDLPLAPADFKAVTEAPKASEAVAKAVLKALKISSLVFQKK